MLYSVQKHEKVSKNLLLSFFNELKETVIIAKKNKTQDENKVYFAVDLRVIIFLGKNEFCCL